MPRTGGLGQGYLPFFFSKNHRLAREASMAGGQKEKGIFYVKFSCE
jgi:hypothetical protein